ncbi:hypothetical protein Moror_5388 [Moniliophthora roreri MCA 2997]|uniref:Uncharacterized protein n=1 Tax=Moniliophthora roreri (strain MCA 2997) TaxID=1381753 RepID=V2WP09_MONRO|nr:hypothetical protein Moror_5388 [Moniliophthora roreri MCA 2997]
MPLCPKAAFLGDHHLSGTTILLGPQFLSPILPAPFLITSFVKLESDLESNNTSKPLSSSLSVQQDSIMCYILLDIVRYICGHDIRRPDAADKVVECKEPSCKYKQRYHYLPVPQLPKADYPYGCKHYDIIHYHLHGPITRTRKPRRSSAYMISPYHVLQLPEETTTQESESESEIEGVESDPEKEDIDVNVERESQSAEPEDESAPQLTAVNLTLIIPFSEQVEGQVTGRLRRARNVDQLLRECTCGLHITAEEAADEDDKIIACKNPSCEARYFHMA